MSRILPIIVLTVASFASQGCVQIYDCIDNRIIECRSKGIAKKAWKKHEGYWTHEPHYKDFSGGFKEGYFAVMQGKGTRPPTLPPRKYWSAGNMKEDCHERTMAWFNGYHAGAAVAQGDGVENLCRIMTSEELYQRKKDQPPVDWNSSIIETTPETLPPVEVAPEMVPPTIDPVPPSPPALHDEKPMLAPPKPSEPIKLPEEPKVQKIGTPHLRTLDLYQPGQRIKKISYTPTE